MSDEPFSYSERYYDENWEYRHVDVTSNPKIQKKFPWPARLLTEGEWRSLGIQQSVGWIHFKNFPNNSYKTLLFRRPKETEKKKPDEAKQIN